MRRIEYAIVMSLLMGCGMTGCGTEIEPITPADVAKGEDGEEAACRMVEADTPPDCREDDAACQAIDAWFRSLPKAACPVDVDGCLYRCTICPSPAGDEAEIVCVVAGKG